MKSIFKTYLLCVVFLVFAIKAKPQVLQIFDKSSSYLPIDFNDVDSISFDIENDLMFIHTNSGETKDFSYRDGTYCGVGESIPVIEINTDEFKEEITSKVDYSAGSFSLRGFGQYEDKDAKVNIRGRGNSSWEFIKKPYRLKFDKKISLCGLPSAKNYVLLANYTDCSLLQNVLAFKIGELLGLPFTNKAVPVDVVFNGIYKGSYILTNKPGINAGSVDIDEDKSIMWELDDTYDEEFKFKSPIFNLPVMVADPDMDEQTFEYWKNDFIEMEKAVYNRHSGDYVDLDMASRYLVVYEIMKNDEIGYPKSFKMYKTEGGKYILGPIWDFDVAMGKVWKGESYSQDGIGSAVWKNSLLSYLSLDPYFKKAYAGYLKFAIDKLPTLLAFIDDYASLIRESALRNQRLYTGYEDFDQSIARLKDWLIKRCEALETLYQLNS